MPLPGDQVVIKNSVQSEEGGLSRTSGHFAHVQLHVSKCFQSGHKSTVPSQFQYYIVQAVSIVLFPVLHVLNLCPVLSVCWHDHI